MLADRFFSWRRPRAASALRRRVRGYTIEHCSFARPDRGEGSDFGPAVVEEIAAAGIYVCPTMNVHAFTLRKRSGDALER
jgi:hypothetical protein